MALLLALTSTRNPLSKVSCSASLAVDLSISASSLLLVESTSSRNPSSRSSCSLSLATDLLISWFNISLVAVRSCLRLAICSSCCSSFPVDRLISRRNSSSILRTLTYVAFRELTMLVLSHVSRRVISPITLNISSPVTNFLLPSSMGPDKFFIIKSNVIVFGLASRSAPTCTINKSESASVLTNSMSCVNLICLTSPITGISGNSDESTFSRVIFFDIFSSSFLAVLSV